MSKPKGIRRVSSAFPIAVRFAGTPTFIKFLSKDRWRRIQKDKERIAKESSTSRCGWRLWLGMCMGVIS